MWLGICRTAFFAVGLWYAIASATGETFINDGNRRADSGDFTGAFFSYLKANGAFPLSNPIREREATIYGIANSLAPDLILAVVDRVLLDDPNNPLLYWYATIQALRGQDVVRARSYLERLKEIGPDWEQTRNAEEVYAAVAAVVEK